MQAFGASDGATVTAADRPVMTDTNTTTLPRLAFTAEEVAQSIGVSLRTVREATYEGLLPCRRLGRLVRYTQEDVQHWLDSHRDAGYVSR